MRYFSTIHQQRNYDFEKILDLLSRDSSNGILLDEKTLEKLTPSHERLFYLKLLIDIKHEAYLESSKDFYNASISMLIECLMQISIGRYRTTHILLRSSLEALCSGIYIELFNKVPNEKFSQNIDLIKKELTLSFTINFDKRKRKLFRRTFNDYVENTIKKSIYWNLSNYVHSTKREFLSSEEFFEDMISIINTPNIEELENTLLTINKLTNNLIILVLISDYEFYFKEPREIVPLAVSKLDSNEKAFLDEWHLYN